MVWKVYGFGLSSHGLVRRGEATFGLAWYGEAGNLIVLKFFQKVLAGRRVVGYGCASRRMATSGEA